MKTYLSNVKAEAVRAGQSEDDLQVESVEHPDGALATAHEHVLAICGQARRSRDVHVNPTLQEPAAVDLKGNGWIGFSTSNISN